MALPEQKPFSAVFAYSCNIRFSQNLPDLFFGKSVQAHPGNYRSITLIEQTETFIIKKI